MKLLKYMPSIIFAITASVLAFVGNDAWGWFFLAALVTILLSADCFVP